MTNPTFTPGLDPMTGYQTRDGRDVELVTSSEEGAYPLKGFVKNSDGTLACGTEWTAEGRFFLTVPNEHSLDLIDRPEPKKTVWVNIAMDGDANLIMEAWATKELADKFTIIVTNKNSSRTRHDRFSCIPVEIPAPGTGLKE